MCTYERSTSKRSFCSEHRLITTLRPQRKQRIALKPTHAPSGAYSAFVVPVRPGYLPTKKKYVRRLTCNQVHYGACRERDRLAWPKLGPANSALTTAVLNLENLSYFRVQVRLRAAGLRFLHYAVAYRRKVGELVALLALDVVAAEDDDTVAGRVLLAFSYRAGCSALRFVSPAQCIKECLDLAQLGHPVIRMTLDRLTVNTTERLDHVRATDAAPTGYLLYPRTHAVDPELKAPDVALASDDALASVMQAGLDALSGALAAPSSPANGPQVCG